MSPKTVEALTAGDRVYRWWDTGAFGPSPQPLTVVRVNRLTVTVRTDEGGTFRLPYKDIAGLVDWEEAS
jgi:hypothetical protein